jgi:hypothetical protein
MAFIAPIAIKSFWAYIAVGFGLFFKSLRIAKYPMSTSLHSSVSSAPTI